MARGRKPRGPKPAPSFKIPMKGDDGADRLALVADQIRRAIERKKHADKMLNDCRKAAAKEGYSLPAILRALKMEGMTDARQAELIERERNNLDLAERYREIIHDTSLEAVMAKPAPAGEKPSGGKPVDDGKPADAKGDAVEVRPAAGDATITGDGSGAPAVPYGADPAAVKRAVRRDAAKGAGKANAGGKAGARPAGRGRLSVVGGAAGETAVY